MVFNHAFKLIVFFELKDVMVIIKKKDYYIVEMNFIFNKKITENPKLKNEKLCQF